MSLSELKIVINEIIDDKDELEEDNQPYKSDYER